MENKGKVYLAIKESCERLLSLYEESIKSLAKKEQEAKEKIEAQKLAKAGRTQVSSKLPLPGMTPHVSGGSLSRQKKGKLFGGSTAIEGKEAGKLKEIPKMSVSFDPGVPKTNKEGKMEKGREPVTAEESAKLMKLPMSIPGIGGRKGAEKRMLQHTLKNPPKEGMLETGKPYSAKKSEDSEKCAVCGKEEHLGKCGY